jgi:hypothetical protein
MDVLSDCERIRSRKRRLNRHHLRETCQVRNAESGAGQITVIAAVITASERVTVSARTDEDCAPALGDTATPAAEQGHSQAGCGG